MAKDNRATPAEFDLDAWVDGTTGITGVARVLQRGDLLAQRDRLKLELDVARKISPDQRSAADRGPDAIQKDLDGVYEELARSMLWCHVQDRTVARREQIAKRLREQQGVTNEETIGLHILADSIVRVETHDGRAKEYPDGFPPEKLIQIRDKGGDAALLDLTRVFREVTTQAPAIQAPLSRANSLTRGGTM